MRSAIDIFGALADPTRLRIMALVQRMELAVGELAQVLGQSQPRVSRHVRILADAGLLQRYKEGAWVFLRVNVQETPQPLLATLEMLLPTIAELPADERRLAEIRAQRVAETRAYFEAHADGWDGIRSLHVADDEVEAAIVAALSGKPYGHVLDIGTGTGRMIELLAPRAVSATGVDRSPGMLRVARGKLEAAALGACQVRQADMYSLPQDDHSIDTIVVHQVLHYAEDPARAIAEAARVLAPGGRLLIVDFTPHALEELREKHAHVRLGFSDETMLGWLAAAGLAARRVAHLAGGTLTVGLWLGEKAPLAGRRAA
jgi:ArsR family transcriptional regulator